MVGFQETSHPRRDGVIWASREEGDLKKEFRSGMALELIATKHQRHKNAILHKLIVLNLFDFTDRGILAGFSESERISYKQPPQAISDPYNVLGIKRSSSNEEIKARYKTLIKSFHPDMAVSKEAKMVFEEKMKEINAAYAEIKREKGI